MANIFFSNPILEALADDLKSLAAWISKKYRLPPKLTMDSARRVPAVDGNGNPVMNADGTPQMVTEHYDMPIVDYIVRAAGDTLFHGGGFSLGDDRLATDRISGKAALPDNETVGRPGEEARGERAGEEQPIGDTVDNFSVGVASLITLLSKRYRMGIMRIAFDELGMMKYLVEKENELYKGLMRALGPDNLGKFIDGLPEFDEGKLKELMHELIPEYVVGAILTNPDSRLRGQIEKAIGASNLQKIADEYEPIGVELTPDLSTPDGKPLGFDDLERLVGYSGKSYEETFPGRKEKYVPRGTEPGEETVGTPGGDAPEWEDGMVANEVSDAMRDKANLNYKGRYRRYRKGRWTVCHITNEEASRNGIIDWPDGTWGQFHNVTHWCITRSSWPSYANHEGSTGEAFYMFRDDFIDRGNNSYTDIYPAGRGFAFYTMKRDGLVYSTNIATDFQDMTDTVHSNYDRYPGMPGFKWEDNGQFPPCADCSKISDISTSPEAKAEALSAYVLFLVGADLSDVPVETGERKRSMLAELMKIYFPSDKITGEDFDGDNLTPHAISCGDCYEVARILNDLGGKAPKMFTVRNEFYTKAASRETPFCKYHLYASPDASANLITHIFDNWANGDRVNTDETGIIMVEFPDGKVKSLTGYPVKLSNVVVNPDAGSMDIYSGEDDQVERTVRLFRPEDSTPTPRKQEIVPRGVKWSIKSKNAAIFPDDKGVPMLYNKRAGGNPMPIGNVRLGNMLDTLSKAVDNAPVSIIPVDPENGRVNILMYGGGGVIHIAYVKGTESDVSRALQVFRINPTRSVMSNGTLVLEPVNVNLRQADAYGVRVGKMAGDLSPKEYGDVCPKVGSLARTLNELQPGALWLRSANNAEIFYAIDPDTLQELGRYDMNAIRRQGGGR